MNRCIKFVRFRSAAADDLIDIVKRRGKFFGGQTEPQNHRPSGRDALPKVNTRLRASQPWVHASFLMNDVAVGGVFFEGLAIFLRAVETNRIVLVIREEWFPALWNVKVMSAE